jgi:DNA (cytosine-5)-methyltransferase 1
MLRYGSVCSGVEAATAAWHPLGWQPQWFSEIEAFPSAVLAHHYPDTPNHGDMTTFKEWPDDPIDLLVGGTPCQSFSVAGLRKGLDDPRGNLMLTYLAIAERYKPRWLVWENVPGVLSSNRGRDFGTFLGALGQLGYGFAYRVLDAQYFGVAQRRRRVFVVGYLGDWRRAAAVLFERESLSGHPAPRRETREEVAACLTRGVGQRYDPETETLPIAFGAQNSANQGDSVSEHVTPTLDKSKTPAAMTAGSVRRLTPVECERLQGFPDDYTLIPYRNRMAADGPRYKAMGNSMAVPIMRWIGKRISEVEAYDQQ